MSNNPVINNKKLKQSINNHIINKQDNMEIQPNNYYIGDNIQYL